MDIYPAKCFSLSWPFCSTFSLFPHDVSFFLSMGLHQRSFVHIIIKPLCHVTLPRTSINDQQISVHWASEAHTAKAWKKIKWPRLFYRGSLWDFFNTLSIITGRLQAWLQVKTLHFSYTGTLLKFYRQVL